MAWTDGIVLKITNILLFAFSLSGNIYNAIAPDAAFAHGKETYITPSYYALWVWSLIHLCLLGTVVYQFTDKGKAIIIDGLGWRLPILALLNAVYTYVWGRNHYVVAFILSLLVSAAVSQCYYIVKTQHKGETLAQELFVHLPFSLWHAWTIVLVIVTGFQAFGVDAHHHKAGVVTKVLVFLAFVFLETTAAAYAFASDQGDAAGAAVLTWSLFAIFIHQTTHRSAFIHWSALAFFILSLFALIKSVYTTFRSGRSVLHDEERAPLVGSS